MKIVSFNLRYDNPEDGVHCLSNRKPLILERIRQESPDIIGFQEAQPPMAAWLRQTLTDYYVIGHGREADYSGEHALIAYRHSLFNLHSAQTLWLSPTPTVPGTRYAAQSICPRTFITLTLYSAESQGLIRVLNTHLDHEGSLARKKGLSRILSSFSTEQQHRALPTLLMGDFNAEPQSSELKLLENSSFFRDFTQELPGTYHDFGQLSRPEKIDYIWGTGEIRLEKACLWTEQKPGQFLSDHYPVCTEVQIGI